MRTLLLALSALTLASCVGMPSMILMKNTATGETRECRGDPWARGALDTEECAKTYERAGWSRV